MDTVDELLNQWRTERPDLDVSALGIAIRIEMLAKKMRSQNAKCLSAVGLKTWEYEVLSALRRQGKPFQLPVSELAKSALLSPGAMTTRIDQLEESRLVKRKADPKDRRGVLIDLTGKGRKLIDRALEARLQAAESAITDINAKEQQTVEHSLRTLLSTHD